MGSSGPASSWSSVIGWGDVAGVDAAGPEVEQLADPVLVAGVHDRAVDQHVVVEELGRAGGVGQDPAHGPGHQEHVVGPVGPEPVAHGRLVPQVELVPGRGEDAPVPLGLQPPHQGRAHQPPMAGRRRCRLAPPGSGSALAAHRRHPAPPHLAPIASVYDSPASAMRARTRRLKFLSSGATRVPPGSHSTRGSAPLRPARRPGDGSVWPLRASQRPAPLGVDGASSEDRHAGQHAGLARTSAMSEVDVLRDGELARSAEGRHERGSDLRLIPRCAPAGTAAPGAGRSTGRRPLHGPELRSP